LDFNYSNALRTVIAGVDNGGVIFSEFKR